MVYCGRPSRACLECRKRRTRCSEGTPSCSQCIRAGRQCSGYRDPLNMVFRYEHEKMGHIETKESDDIIRRDASSTKKWNFQHETFGDLVKAQVLPNVVNQTKLLPSYEEQARNYVVNNYIFRENESSSSEGLLQYDVLLCVYSKLPPRNILEDAMLAVGLAALGHQKKSKKLVAEALSVYSRALHRVSSALGNIAEAKCDGVLLGVELLVLFETHCCSMRSLKSWMKHLRGMISLLRLRGEEQLHTDIGRRLFLETRGQISNIATLCKVAMPQYIIEWTKIAMQYDNTEEAASSALVLIRARLCALRASEYQCNANDCSKSPSIISEALEIDAQLVRWASQNPPSYEYSQVTMSEPNEEVFSDYYHIYNDAFTGSLWNHWRSMRIMLHALISTHTDRFLRSSTGQSEMSDEGVAAPYENQRKASQSTIDEMIYDICASAPFFLNFHLRDTERPGEHPPVQALRAHCMIWSLYGPAIATRVSNDMREWIVRTLRYVGETLGLRQANTLAEIIEKKEELDVSENEFMRLADIVYPLDDVEEENKEKCSSWKSLLALPR